MNEELKKIAVAAGAPEDVLDTLWFNMFCQEFAHLILLMAEEEYKWVAVYTYLIEPATPAPCAVQKSAAGQWLPQILNT